jgi:hypothetical protein
VAEEERLLGQRLMDAEQSKSKLQIISRNKASSINHPGTAGAVGWGGNFIVSIGGMIYEELVADCLVRKMRLPPSQRRARCSRRLVFPRTNFWILFSTVSGNISIGL